MRRHQPSRGSRLLLLALSPVVVVTLAACAPGSSPAPSEPATSSAAAPSPAGSATPTATAAADSAEARLPDFTSVMDAVWRDSASVKGRVYVDALVAAGFPKKAMQVTEDETSIGNPADSIQFSVRIGDECLVGQVGPSVAKPTALVMPGLADGACLLGQTRSIDW
ncbi:DUF6993 domain-containing protein [Microbacterium sp. LMI1x-1-1.1]|uniref:DUF6993 domain-containing protein n=1 Tax=Microbacterium sp. LMI1x-1-1.1 TaxID=3135246 RepID=UPI00342E6D53